MKIFAFLIGLLTCNILLAQLPETDIFLCSIRKDSTNYFFSKPENITNRPGYENQPYFTPDGNKILYVVADSQQTDIFCYNIKAKINLQFTETRESEYSPSYTPDRKYLSVVRVDADSGQRYHTFSLDDLRNPHVVKNTDSIGYACWLNDSSLAMFILGPAHTLQVLNTKSSERKLIASDIGRCMKLSPDGSKMYFVLKSNPSEWFIYAMDCISHKLVRIAQTLPRSEDFAILPDGNIIMGSEGKLFLFVNNSDWKMIADFSTDLKDFYRLAVNGDGTLLTLVAFSGKKP
jgi:Tol biopolymer transport system component